MPAPGPEEADGVVQGSQETGDQAGHLGRRRGKFAPPVYVAKTAPCMDSCPSGTDVRGWLVPLAQHEAYGRTPAQAFEFAWRKILEHNPFPAVCGRVCQHPCELSCNRKAKDGPVAVKHLEQFIGDFAIAQGLRVELPAPRRLTRRAIAVVGAGPAGLSAAYHLARKGYAVTVFDAAPQAGGMMRYRIPRAMIPAEVLDAEIGNILRAGDRTANQMRGGPRHLAGAVAARLSGCILCHGLAESGAAGTARRRRWRSGYWLANCRRNCPKIPARKPAEAEPRVLNTVSVAIAQGRTVAETIAAHLEGCPSARAPSPAVIRSDQVKLDWYPAAQRHSTAARRR